MKKCDLIAELNSFSSEDFDVIFEHTTPKGDAKRVVFQTDHPTILGGSTEAGPTLWITMDDGGGA